MKKPFLFLFCFTCLVVSILSSCEPTETSSRIDADSITSMYLNRNVKLWTYLPPNYNAKAKQGYKVIYMHDGQNLFQDELSFVGEWKVDESLDSLFKQTGKQIVVIGIENGGEKRLAELTPYKNEKYGGGTGDNYLQFITDELIPYVESKWNISTNREDRAIWGSSLGGLISYYAAYKTDAFSKFGIYSPSFWYSDSIFTITRQHKLPRDTRMAMTIGMKEQEEHKNVIKMETLLKVNQRIQLDTEIIPDGEHSEWFWAREFYDDVNWLFKE